MAMPGGAGNTGRPPLPNIVPSIFASSIRGTRSKNMTLRDCDNNLWRMKIEKLGDDWYFTEGWKKFVQDNKIEGGDVLVYEGSSRGLINFKILGSSGCEEGVEHLKSRGTEGQDEEMEVKAEDVKDAGDVDEKPTIPQDDHPQQEQVVDAGAKCKRKRKRNGDIYGTDIFSTGQFPLPVNPYFVTYPNQTRVNELYIPMDVVKSHSLELPEKLVLFDSFGRKYLARRKIWKDGRVLYYGGWKTVCRVNLAEKDDKIVCEFVPGESGDLQLGVSFVRANRQQG